MPSKIDQLARGVRDALNNAPQGAYSGHFENWVSDCPAIWRHMPSFKREAIGDLRVVISSDPDDAYAFDETFRDRCCESPMRPTVFVGIAKRATTFDENLDEYSDQDELEALKELAECIAELIYAAAILVNGEVHTVAAMEWAPFWDAQTWRDNRIFLSVLTVTY